MGVAAGWAGYNPQLGKVVGEGRAGWEPACSAASVPLLHGTLRASLGRGQWKEGGTFLPRHQPWGLQQGQEVLLPLCKVLAAKEDPSGE